MIEKIKQILDSFGEKIANVDSISELGNVKVKYLGKSGEVTELLKGLKNFSAQEKPALGKKINELRQTIENKINEPKEELNRPIRYRQSSCRFSVHAQCATFSQSSSAKTMGIKSFTKKCFVQCHSAAPR